MLMKAIVPFLALVVTQASASIIGPLVERSNLELLAARQIDGPCGPTCAPFSDAVDSCTTTGCLCTTTIARSLQACIDCAIRNSPDAPVKAAAQTLIDSFKTACTGALDPTLTIPVGTPTGTGSVPVIGSSGGIPSSTRAVVTAVTSDPNIPKTVVGPSSTGPTPSALGITKSSSLKNVVQKMSVVAIGAMVGFTLAL